MNFGVETTMKLRSRLLQVSLLTLSLGLVSSLAHAGTPGLEVCGDVDIEINANCEVWIDIECDTRCEPLLFELSCSKKLWKICDGQCNATLDLDCDRACTEVCVPKCTVDPGNFSCEGTCELDCGASCDAYCQANADSAQCQASCQAECSGRCSLGCEGQLPELSCDERCGDVCGARCEAEANIDCQVKCQAPEFGTCQANISGGCKTQCESDGALFCDGEFIDHGGRLKECVAAIDAYITSHVKVYGEASAECGDGSCMAEASAGISCECRSTEEGGPSPWWTASLLTLLGIRRRRAE